MINAIPNGKETATPHLIVDNGGEAIDFYKLAFDVEV
jgi:uncharacterized glyoxalase superfamily protein PhnB